jgi:Uma2 family endonuclease
MSTTNSVIFEDWLEIPVGLRTLADFRRWALSDAFPEEGRIDYIDGRIEVDMSPEDLFCHGTLKTELVRGLLTLVKASSSGYVFTDSTRVSSPAGQLSVEPDIVYMSKDSITQGRATWVPKASKKVGRFVEIEGAPDLVVEIISDSSAGKDTKRLPNAYFASGTQELWLLDARQDEMLFELYIRGKSAFVQVKPDANGFRRSHVLAKSFRLDRRRDENSVWTFDLQVR